MGAVNACRHTEESVAFTLKPVEPEAAVEEMYCNQTSLRPTYCVRKEEHGGLEPAELRSPPQPEEEHRKLKALVTDMSPDQAMLQDGR
ncbi:hypothetical protein C5O80_34400 [Burkholderia sp. SRS-46]|nr:hypothetical protein C5O80_34400 [Burkholderia sp. SRS-46]